MPAHARIAAMAPEDLEEVLAVENQCHSHPWSGELFLRELANPISSIDLLWRSGDLAGYLCSWMVEGELHILNVATAPKFRRQGVARELMEYALARGRQKGLTRAFLEVRVGNEAAIALYRSFGFRPAGHRRRYYADGEDALVMEYTDSPRGSRFEEERKE